MDKRWLIRAGAVMVLFGFVLPAVSISVNILGFNLLDTSYSIYQMISLGKITLLLLIPTGSVITLIASFINSSETIKPGYLFLAQVGGIALGFLSVMITGIQYYSKYGKSASSMSDSFKEIFKYAFDILQDVVTFNLEFGLFLFIAGYALLIVGLLFLAPEALRPAPRAAHAAPYQQPYVSMAEPAYSYPPVATFTSPPWLDVLSGNFAQTPVQITSNIFLIGRGQNNNLNLADPSVSHQHAQIYNAQGGWYIQDSGSLAGLYVNDLRIQAKQLFPGDMIRIGTSLFRFMQYQ